MVAMAVSPTVALVWSVAFKVNEVALHVADEWVQTYPSTMLPVVIILPFTVKAELFQVMLLPLDGPNLN